jgi:type I restriction enzyme S subunit
MEKNKHNIPPHWKLVSLLNDLQFIKTGVQEYTGKKKYYSTGSIKEDKITSEGEYEFKNKPSRANRIAKLGDVFQARMKNTDKAILINSEFDEQLFSTGFFQIRGDDKFIFNKFIFYYLTSSVFKELKDKMCSGSTQSALNDESAKKINVPLPPFEEQQAIVAKIEELLSELDNGKQQLLTAQQQLKVYRQSLLKWAFENNDYPIFNMVDLNIKIQIGPFGTQLHKEDYIDNGIPLINPMHIQNGKIIPNYSYSIRNEKMQSLPNYILKEGDVIMGRRGEMGRCGLVSKTEDGWFCGTGSLYFRPNTTKLNSKFLYYYLSSQPIKKYLELNAGGTTMANLNLKIVKEIPIKLPTIEEQTQIVNEIESKLTVCDKIEETISQSLQQAESLRQSILKKAFEGKLVNVVAEKREAKVIPLYQPKNKYFYQMQLLGIVAKTSKQKQIEHGEMTLAKYTYLMDKVYDVPTYFNYNRWHLGPYPPTIKKVINNKQYFKKSGNHIEVLNEKTLFNSTNPHTAKMQSAVNDLTEIFSKYSTKERSHKTELLGTVCKVIEDIQSTDLKTVRQSMAEWKINLKGEKYKTKAEKFNEAETEKCLAFIKEKGWDKKLMK